VEKQPKGHAGGCPTKERARAIGHKTPQKKKKKKEGGRPFLTITAKCSPFDWQEWKIQDKFLSGSNKVCAGKVKGKRERKKKRAGKLKDACLSGPPPPQNHKKKGTGKQDDIEVRTRGRSTASCPPEKRRKKKKKKMRMGPSKARKRCKKEEKN